MNDFYHYENIGQELGDRVVTAMICENKDGLRFVEGISVIGYAEMLMDEAETGMWGEVHGHPLDHLPWHRNELASFDLMTGIRVMVWDWRNQYDEETALEMFHQWETRK